MKRDPAAREAWLGQILEAGAAICATLPGELRVVTIRAVAEYLGADYRQTQRGVKILRARGLWKFDAHKGWARRAESERILIEAGRKIQRGHSARIVYQRELVKATGWTPAKVAKIWNGLRRRKAWPFSVQKDGAARRAEAQRAKRPAKPFYLPSLTERDEAMTRIRNGWAADPLNWTNPLRDTPIAHAPPGQAVTLAEITRQYLHEWHMHINFLAKLTVLDAPASDEWRDAG